MAKTPTPAQLAARERFAAMARAGAFKRKPAAKRAKNPAPKSEQRNRTGIVIKRGNWVQGRDIYGQVIEGVIMRVTGRGVDAYVTLTDGRTLAADDVTQTLGPMTVDPSGIVRQNPLTRVKRNSPSMATGEAPSARLRKRRAKTAKAPAGYYANPMSEADAQFVREARARIKELDSQVLAAIDARNYTKADKLDRERSKLWKAVDVREGRKPRSSNPIAPDARYVPAFPDYYPRGRFAVHLAVRGKPGELLAEFAKRDDAMNYARTVVRVRGKAVIVVGKE